MASSFGAGHYQSLEQRVDAREQPYLLVDEELIVSLPVLFGQVSLYLSQITALLEELPLSSQVVSLDDFSLTNKSDELPGLFELLPQFLEFLYALGISATGLADLAYFPSPEADIGVPIFCVSAGTELWKH